MFVAYYRGDISEVFWEYDLVPVDGVLQVAPGFFQRILLLLQHGFGCISESGGPRITAAHAGTQDRSLTPGKIIHMIWNIVDWAVTVIQLSDKIIQTNKNKLGV